MVHVHAGGGRQDDRLVEIGGDSRSAAQYALQYRQHARMGVHAVRNGGGEAEQLRTDLGDVDGVLVSRSLGIDACAFRGEAQRGRRSAGFIAWEVEETLRLGARRDFLWGLLGEFRTLPEES